MPTRIEWADETWNPIRARSRETGKAGHYCQKVSPGCKHCYAEKMNGWRGNGAKYAVDQLDQVEVYLDEEALLQPLRWKKPRMVFVCSMTDLFAGFVKDEWLDQIHAVMLLCPQHTFQVLTKRPERMRGYLRDPFRMPGVMQRVGEVMTMLVDDMRFNVTSVTDILQRVNGHAREEGDEVLLSIPNPPWPLPHIWNGVSVEDQPTANERIPLLLETPSAVRFVSAEPLLEELDLALLKVSTGYINAIAGKHWLAGAGSVDSTTVDCAHLDWVICGGESGPGARAMDPRWARSLRAQCFGSKTSFFMKQMGTAYGPEKGANIPAELMVREWPAWR